MSRIRSKDTKPEMLVRKFLFANGFRYRLHERKLPGNPDIVLPKHKVIVMVNGCFWHGHDGCSYYLLPRTRTQWWKEKINSNKLRDEMNENKLRFLGWDVLTVFECELKSEKQKETLANLIDRIRNGHTRN
jgi:DNA mismatch endonuclease (patch repair protein)